jgi:hypothetical protein
MKSHKIWRLEFVSDKIETGDSKRKVVHICFSHASKKNDLGWRSPWKGGHGQTLSSMGQPWGLVGEGREREGVVGEWERRLLAVGRWNGGRGAARGGGYFVSSCCSCKLVA